jgi:acetolactate synthase-1/2/3 large subunit
MEELKAFAEAARLPVVTTLMAKSSFPESHELHFGWPGMHGPKWSNYAINKADLLIAVGARFDDRVTGKLSAFAPGADVIHFDIDPAEIGKLRKADIPVVGRGSSATRSSPGGRSPGCSRSPPGARSSRSATAPRPAT